MPQIIQVKGNSYSFIESNPKFQTYIDEKGFI